MLGLILFREIRGLMIIYTWYPKQPPFKWMEMVKQPFFYNNDLVHHPIFKQPLKKLVVLEFQADDRIREIDR